MRRTLAAAAVAIGLAAPLVPLTSANACYQLGKVCVPSECMLAATAVRTVNNAAGQPLGTNPPPHCID
jgi:hypothetical protein